MSARQAMRVSAALLLACGCSDAGTPVPHFVPVAIDAAETAGALSMAWADYDNDVDLDLVVTYASGEVRLIRNNAGQLESAGEQPSMQLASGEARAAAWGDYDADGDVDLFVGARNGISALFRNDGAGRFTNVAADLALELPDVNARQSSWIDYDNDGKADLFVANRSGTNRLFHNVGGQFVDVSESSGLADERPAVGACWFDYEQDGDLDVFVTNQSGKDDALFRNDGGTFVDMAARAGVVQAGRTEDDGGVGCSIADFDNDGRFDIFVATYGRDLLYRNRGDGRYSEMGSEAGVDQAGYMVGASWGDVNNDGHPDLYVAGYVKTDDERMPDDRLYLNVGGRFERVAVADGIPNDADHAIQWADFDGDGLLDLAATDGYDSSGEHIVYRNVTDNGAARGSLRVEVLDGNGHHTRAGAEVRVFSASGELLGTQLVATGDGYNSQGTQPLHFGVGAQKRVIVEVTYMTGSGRKAQRTGDVDVAGQAGKVLTVMQQVDETERGPERSQDSRETK